MTNLFGGLSLVLGCSLLVACGGEEEPAATIDLDVGETLEVAMATETAEVLTAEEAAQLEAFRASRQAANAANPLANPTAPVANPLAASAPGSNPAVKVDPNRSAWDIAAEAVAREKTAQRQAQDSSPAPAPVPNPLAQTPTPPVPQPRPPIGPAPQPTPSPKPTAAAAKSGAVAFKKQTLKEQSTGMPAYTLLVPQGWSLQSSVQRTPPQLGAMFAMTDVLVTAPDGREIHFYPGMTFHHSPDINAAPMQPVYQKFFLAPPRSVGDFILDAARRNGDPAAKNLRVVSEEDLPALTRRVRELAAGTFQSMEAMRQQSMPGDEIYFDTRGVKVVLRYEKNGKTREKTFITQFQIQSFKTAMTGAIVQWGLYNMRSITGPIGSDYMHDPTLITIAQSMQMTPQWAKAQHRYYVARAPKPRVNQPRSAQKTPGEIDAETRQSSLDGWKKNQDINDQGSQKFIDTIFEETPYTDTDGETVRVSSHWDHVASDGQGNILMHNDPNWNPNTDANWNQRDWKTLNPQY